MAHNDIHHVVIIGAGFGGLTCAKKLAKKKNVRITLLDRQNHHLFQPLLYQVATATLSSPDIARSIRGIFSNKTNVEINYDEAKRISIEDKKVHLLSGKEIAYDSLVLATGARSSFFGNDHWRKHVHQLKALNDAVGIRRHVLRNLEFAEQAKGKEQRTLSTVVIVGGGPTGVELAGAFSDLIKRNMKRNFRHFDTSQQRIILIEAQDYLLGAFDEKHSEYTEARLTKLGVEVQTNTMVSDISEDLVTLANGKTIEATTIIWTAGVEAAPINHTLGVELTRSGLVKVNPDLTIPDHPSAFVIGDAAAVLQKNGDPVPGVAPAAAQGGKHVARTLIKYKFKGKEEYPAFRYRDKGQMAIIGKWSAVVQVKKWKVKGWFAWMIWLFIHVLFLVDFRSKIGVMFNWFWAYIFNIQGSRVFTNPSSKNIPPS